MENQNLSLLELEKMIQQILRVFKKRLANQPYEEIKISTSQLILLHAISLKDEEVIQSDIAKIIGKDKSALLRMIDPLEEKGLIRRVNDLKDKRKNYLFVTKVGYRVLGNYMKIVNELMFDIQQGLTSSEIEIFQKVVRNIKRNVETL